MTLGPARCGHAAIAWPIYLQEWTFWNHIRTAASLAAAAGGMLALMAW